MKRLIATLVIKDGLVVQSLGFKKYLPIGKPEIAVEFLNSWGIDEIVLLDIEATNNNRLIDSELVKKAAKKCFVPLAIGGGVKDVADAEILLQAGADKIVVNHAARENLSIIDSLATTYGNQFVVVGIDIIQENGQYHIYDYTSGEHLSEPFEYVRSVVDMGAGELFINAVHKDGSYAGYDIQLIEQICSEVDLPVIASGGAGNAQHILELLASTKASAASASNYFNFYEHSVTVAKALLNKNEIDIRNETYANYYDHPLSAVSRLNKKEDQILENMRFIKIEREII